MATFAISHYTHFYSTWVWQASDYLRFSQNVFFLFLCKHKINFFNWNVEYALLRGCSEWTSESFSNFWPRYRELSFKRFPSLVLSSPWTSPNWISKGNVKLWVSSILFSDVFCFPIEILQIYYNLNCFILCHKVIPIATQNIFSFSGLPSSSPKFISVDSAANLIQQTELDFYDGCEWSEPS